MKNVFYAAVACSMLLALNLSCTFAQTSYIYIAQPDPADGKDASVNNIYPDSNYGNAPDFLVCNTLKSFQSMENKISRALLYFPLHLPSDARIDSASLNVANRDPWGPYELVLSDICRITTPWDETVVTWNNQPAFSTADQISTFINATPIHDASVDVTTLVQSMVANPDSSFGFLIKSNNEDSSFNQWSYEYGFNSNNHLNPLTRPKLIVYYTSSSPFVILIAPRITSVCYANAPFRVTWNASNIGSLKIEYSWDQIIWNTIDEAADASVGFYDWIVPDFSTGGSMRIRVSDSSGMYADTSKAFMVQPASYLKLKPGPVGGKDAFIEETHAGGPGGWFSDGQDSTLEVGLTKWTGYSRDVKSYIEFDLSAITEQDSILNAEFVMYLGRHANNQIVISRVTSPWEEDSLNASQLPSFASGNKMKVITASTNDSLAFIINVTALVRDMTRSQSYGFVMESEPLLDPMNTLSSLDTVLFYSSDYSDAAKRPELRISYIKDTTISIGFDDLFNEQKRWSMYPNPSNGNFAIEFSNTASQDIRYSVYSLDGRQLLNDTVMNTGIGNVKHYLNIGHKGVFIMQLECDGKKYYKKLIVL